ncbi:MAG: SPOR domain-containing protein [Polaribacter sp.]|nr:SPOR domain-containing protein [Polaribacter sp.]
MNLANYINDLLYRYNCIIIPNFGGFVTNKIGATIDEATRTFNPPKKQITFNSHLKKNDGLLANYIATSENISFEEASNAIDRVVAEWKNDIQTNPLQIGAVGVLTLNERGQIIFEPNLHVNYLSSSFGLSSVESASIERYKQQVKPIIPVHTAATENKKGIPTFIKYAASAAILLTLGFFGNNAYLQNKQQTILANQEKAIEKKIQSATFVIPNPLPTIELNVVKEIEKPFHIVAGAFQIIENAEKKVTQLKELGYDAKIIGTNKWGLTEVSFNSFADRNDAINSLYKIQRTISADAWLLEK